MQERKNFSKTSEKAYNQSSEWVFPFEILAITDLLFMNRKLSQAVFFSAAILAQIQNAFADAGFIWGNGITEDKIRRGDFTFDDIPTVILNATNFFLWFAASISVVMIIYGAFRLSLWSLHSEKDEAKKIIIASIIWFMLAVSSWAIIKIVMTNL